MKNQFQASKFLINRNGLMCVEDLTKVMENISQRLREKAYFPSENQAVKAGGRRKGLAYYNVPIVVVSLQMPFTE